MDSVESLVDLLSAEIHPAEEHPLFDRIKRIFPLLRLMLPNESYKSSPDSPSSVAEETKEAMSRVLLKAILRSDILFNKTLTADVETMLDDVDLKLTTIPESAYVATAALLLVSYLTDLWPCTILASPQDTINFKHGKRTLVIYGTTEFDLIDFDAKPHITTFVLSDVLSSLSQLADKELTVANKAICDVILPLFVEELRRFCSEDPPSSSPACTVPDSAAIVFSFFAGNHKI